MRLVDDLKPSGLGVVLAAANVIVIAIGLGITMAAREPHGHPLGIAFFVCVFAMMPAVIVGALLGWAAGIIAPLPVWLRRCVLTLPALALVFVLADRFAMYECIAAACVPTVVATSILERATRLVVAPPLPVAQARRR